MKETSDVVFDNKEIYMKVERRRHDHRFPSGVAADVGELGAEVLFSTTVRS